MDLVFVHGRSQQGKDPDSLKAQWCSVLSDGLSKHGIELPSDARVSLPFYGDKLEVLRKKHSGYRVRGNDGAPVDIDFARFQSALVAELAEKTGVSVSPQEAGGTRGPANWEWVHKILKVLDRRFPGVGDGTLSRFTEDVYLYLTIPEIRSTINRVVAGSISSNEAVVVSHSLGTVVAYNVLQQKRWRDKQFPKFVTLGSPLGLRAITSKLDLPLSFPQSAATWYNAYDEADIVALNPLSKEYFPVDGSIRNNNAVKNHTNNRHGIGGYLDDSNIALEIAHCLDVIADS